MAKKKQTNSTEQQPQQPPVDGHQLELLQNVARIYDGVQKGKTISLGVVYVDDEGQVIRAIHTDGQFPSQCILVRILQRMVNVMCASLDQSEARARSEAMLAAQRAATEQQAQAPANANEQAPAEQKAPDDAQPASSGVPKVSDKPAGNA